MANFAAGLPLEKGIFRFAYRNTGDAWSSDQVMDGGAGDQSKTFASPVCDELRISVSFDEATVFSNVHFSRLSIISGLTFAPSWIGTTYPQSIEARPDLFQSQTIRSTSTPNTDFNIVITGLAQRSLTFDQVVFCSNDWQPAQNFDDESRHKSHKKYQRQRTKNHSRQRLTDSARILSLNFWDLTEDEFLDLQHLCEVVSDNGYLFIQLDSAGGSERDSFLADCLILGYKSNSTNNKQCQLQVIEKDS